MEAELDAVDLAQRLFADAERLDAYQLPLDFHEHSPTHSVAPDRTDALVELAWAAVMVARWTSTNEVALFALCR